MSLQEINQLSMNERVRKGHPGNMHLWWNRSPIESSKQLLRSIISGSAEMSGTHDQKITKNDDRRINKNITIVDPFSGFGGLVLAATEAGYPVKAGDLNSVAALLTKAVAEIPSQFADQHPVSRCARDNSFIGVQGLAEDVQYYGNWIRSELEKSLKALYPESVSTTNISEKRVYAWIWTRTVPCPNPACGCTMPMAGSYVLAKIKGKEYYVQPEVKGHHVLFQVKKGLLKDAQNGNKIGNSGAKFRCPSCGEITTDEYVKEMGKAGKLGTQLIAVGYESDTGRVYEAPSQIHIISASTKLPVDLPLGDLPNNTRWFSPPLFGLTRFTDLYTSRQLHLMTELCDLVEKARMKVYEEAIKAGMQDDGISLSNKGKGAYAYSQAVSVYLSLVVGKIANFQSQICTWDNRKGNIRAAFTRQAIPMTWVFAEGNPFSSVTGNFDTMLGDVVRTIEALPCSRSADVLQGDGIEFPFPANAVLFTELPYYDNVGYADLSDYFYIWLRRCLRDVYPTLFKNIVTAKEELTSIPEHYGGDPIKARAAYQEGISRLFQNYSDAADRTVPSLVFFEFGRADEMAMRSSDQTVMHKGAPNSTGKEVSAWENLVDSINKVGFHVKAVLPVRTEKPSEKYESTRVCVIFQKRNDTAPQTTRRGFVSELKRELPARLQVTFMTGIDEWDYPIVGVGVGLSLFTKYKKIINADGSNMQTIDALRIIWTEIEEYTHDYTKGSAIEAGNEEL